ncbi:MAG: helix-turn-helix transcriptional regulator [Pirellulales bacterium]|nr:helix-turn-helix transcriptional regulator [Pirellulales bacterium]
MITDAKAKANIAANVQRLMEMHGFTQAQLAEATGETQGAISKVLNGHHMPGAGFLARLAEALDYSTDKLLAKPPTEARRQSA